MRCTYINHNGKSVEFNSDSICVSSGSVHGRKWEPQTTSMSIGEIVDGFKRGAQEYSLVITCRGTRAERLSQLDELHDMFDSDIESAMPGTLYYGDWYCKCFITETSYSAGTLPTWMNQTMNIYVPSGFWWKEETVSISKQNASLSDVTYPTVYPFTYGYSVSDARVVNRHYTESDFKLVAYGPLTGLNVTIGGVQYRVDHAVASGEYMVLDTRDGNKSEDRCYLVKSDGTHVNCYNDRKTNIMQKIQPGTHDVTYSRDYGIDITFLHGRSEPKWYQ